MNEKEHKLFEYVMSLAIGECYTEEIKEVSELEKKILEILKTYESMKRIVEDGMINITKDGIVHMSREAYNRFRSYKHNLDMGIEYLKENACYENTISELFCDDLDTDSCMELLDILRGEDNESN